MVRYIPIENLVGTRYNESSSMKSDETERSVNCRNDKA